MLRGALFSVADVAPIGVRYRSSSASKSKAINKSVARSLDPKFKKSVTLGSVEAADDLHVDPQQPSCSPLWGHAGERQRYARVDAVSPLKALEPIGFDSLEHPIILNEAELAGGDYGSDLRSSRKALTPGSYFESRRANYFTNGIILAWGLVHTGTPNSVIGISTEGQCISVSASDIMFHVPNFVDSYLVQRAGKGTVHENDHELTARLKLSKRACDFERQVEFKQFELAHKIPDLYERVRAEDPNEWGMVNTLQAARLLEGTPNVPIVTLFAVHRVLMERVEEYVCHPSHHHLLHLFSVRPYAHVKNYWKVRQWNRDRDGRIANFVKKANMLIKKRLALTEGSDNEPPTPVWEGKELSFSEDDKEIIRFLQLSMSLERKIQDDPYKGFASSLIKDCLKSEYHISKDSAYNFLQDIGVYTPWEDLPSKNRELKLPSDLEPSLIEPVSSIKSGEWRGNRTDSPKIFDSHESVRHDFGDLPVFVIDDAQAEELDDGVSIETVPGEPSSVWIHVHIADPTVLLLPTRPIVQNLLDRSESLYFIQRAWPMLPKSVSEVCQLGSSTGGGQNVLTVSAKLDDRGEILDHKVRAGYVRNVHKLKYDDVNELLEIDLSSFVSYPFEPPSMRRVAKAMSHADSFPHVETLKRLYEITRRYKNRSLTENSFSFSYDTAEVTSLDRPFPSNQSEPTHPTFYRGFPNLRYSVKNYRCIESGSRSLVAECMKIAGRAASRFCVENNIPVIRRSLLQSTFDSDADLEEARSLRDELGYLDIRFVAAGKFRVPPAEFTTEPAEHSSLGVPNGEGYIRGTSPLRRAEDLISHWQIKHALLKGSSRQHMPFTEDDLKRMCADLTLNKIVINRTMRQHRRNWTQLYISRYLNYRERLLQGDTSTSSLSTAQVERDPLRNLEAIVLKTPTMDKWKLVRFIDVYIPCLGTEAVCITDEDLPRASTVRVNVKHVEEVDLLRNLVVTAVES